MFSHITVGVSDLSRTARFYDAILKPLGLRQRPVTPDGGPASLCWIMVGEALPRFYAYSPFNGQAATAGNGGIVAFLAPTEAAVSAALSRAARMKAQPAHGLAMATAISEPICATLTETRFTLSIGAILLKRSSLPAWTNKDRV